MFGGGLLCSCFWIRVFSGGGFSTPPVVGLVLLVHAVFKRVLFVEELEWFCIPFAATDRVLLLVQISWW
jgi:hypothetical protein